MMVKFVLLLLVTSLIALSAIVIDASTFTPYIPRKAKTFLRTQQSIFLCPSQTSTFKCNLNENAQPSRKFGQSVGIRDGIHSIRQRRNRQARIIASSQSQTLLPCIFNRVIPRGGSADDLNEIVLDKSTIAPKSNIRMYGWCLFVVLVWITTGTIFYSKFNSWPLPQSFFYAVDAGMSIGFCTDVMETRVGSRAFTIVFILLGASCVGGALLLFIKDIMEGAVVLRNDAFEQLLAAHAAKRYEKKGKLTHEQFRMLVEEWTQKHIGDETFHKLCRRFDPCDNGTISSQKFVQRCHEMATLLNTDGPLYSDRFIVRKAAQVREFMRESVDITHRWGHTRQGWDLITSTHFAISALATGGLTGPEVNAQGILPTEPALFCGFFCLFGIPLFALTLGHFARVLVEGYIVAVEEKAVIKSVYQPLIVTEFEYAKNLCSSDGDIHLSDFLVLQLLRQGKIDIRLVKLIKAQFDALDTDGSGRITFDEAMIKSVIPGFECRQAGED
eukprot:scaffold666_cov272-Chaetoceros_neogracile.AAC.25